MKIDAYCSLGVDREYDLTETGLLKSMDKMGVDRAVIAPVDRFLAVNNRQGNDKMLRAAENHGDRFIPACSANPWYGPDALKELKRTIANGARMFVLHPAVQGFLANDELVWPLLELASSEEIPAYMHTGPPGSATPWQVVDLAERFPALDFIMGHCGATDFWRDVVGATQASPNIFLEASLSRPFLFIEHLKQAGWEKGIMGSFAPINDFCFEWEQMRMVLPEGASERVFGGNLRRILERRRPL